MATRKTSTRKKKASKPITVVVGATIKRGGISDELDAKRVPAELKKALADLQAKRIDEAAACKVVTKYLTANFLASNLPDGEDLFAEEGEVEAHEVECYGLWLAGGPLPRVTAAANFTVKVGKALPGDQEAMQDWEDDNTPLTDAVNFFWRFGEIELVIGEHEGAGAGIEDFPK